MPNPRETPLRSGYTTGTCAAAAAKACALLLTQKSFINEVCVTLPSGDSLAIPVTVCRLEPDGQTAVAEIVKDAGDDPDITDGMTIRASLRLNPSGEITIDGGKGIGRVTEPGLKVPVGAAAINPAPLSMIKQNVCAVLPPGIGAVIIISAPEGEEIAKKTYNPRLGIVGGISILGTTGIVRPMSEDAWKQSLALELSVVRRRGHSSCVFAFGNYGERYAIEALGRDPAQIVIISNFIGYMIDEALALGFEKILLVGHIGKIVKVAGGIFQTHSRQADARMEILCCMAGLLGADKSVLHAIYETKLTSQAAGILKANGLEAVYALLAESASKKMHQYAYQKITFGTVLFDDENRLLAMDENAQRMTDV